MIEYDEFRKRVRAAVDEQVAEGPPVTFDEPDGVWVREALRVSLTPAGDEKTVVASRTAPDLFGVGNTLGMRYDLAEDNVADCVASIVVWLNNPKLYTRPKTPPRERVRGS